MRKEEFEKLNETYPMIVKYKDSRFIGIRHGIYRYLGFRSHNESSFSLPSIKLQRHFCFKNKTYGEFLNYTIYKEL